jgi:hypothetical protein
MGQNPWPLGHLAHVAELSQLRWRTWAAQNTPTQKGHVQGATIGVLIGSSLSGKAEKRWAAQGLVGTPLVRRERRSSASGHRGWGGGKWDRRGVVGSTKRSHRSEPLTAEQHAGRGSCWHGAGDGFYVAVCVLGHVLTRQRWRQGLGKKRQWATNERA